MVKGKRWKRGESSSSNPTTHKYRDIAKNNRSFFNFGLPSENSKSTLTSKALAQLDSMSTVGKLSDNNNFDLKSVDSDAESMGTFRSWASNWSDCTNATFNKVHRYWRSNSALHKEILAVLAAITEVIKENNGQETETEYFAALMTGMESVKENEESTAAFLYLIALAIKKVPENVLRAKYSDLLAKFMEPIKKFGLEANNATLIKSCLMCLCWLLKSQDQHAWEKETTKECYYFILNFVNHSKPKIRKCGQEAVRLILNSYSSMTESMTRSYEYISAMTAHYCLRLIMNQRDDENEAEENETKSSNKNVDQIQNILYVLNLIRHVVHHFQVSDLKTIGECLLRLMTFRDTMLTATCFQIFYQLFNAHLNHLNSDLNAQMINAFYDYKPSDNDPQQMIAWLAVVESSIKSLNRLNKKLCLPHLPLVFQTFMQVLSASHHKNIHTTVTNCLCSILEQCVETNMQILVDDLKQQIDGSKKSVLGKLFSHIENGLSYQFHSVWIFVMKILACAFTSFKNKQSFVIIEKCIKSLANLRESEQFEYKKEADIAIGRAVENFGPKLILECVPLGITGDETSYDYARSWLLPLLKDYIEKTELAYFTNYFLPLAIKLRNSAIQFGKNNQIVEYKIFDTLQNQIWALLPGFCNFPTDFDASFKNLARILGETLEKCFDLRYYILQSLRVMINRNTDENKTIVAKFAKNYLPIMFNLYITEVKSEKDPVRQSLIETTRTFLKITDKQQVNVYLSQAMRNYENYSIKHDETLKLVELQQKTSDTKQVHFDFNKMSSINENSKKSSSSAEAIEPNLFAKHSSLDLIAVLVQYSDETNINQAYNLALSGIEDKNIDKIVQKKCYKILESILSNGKLNKLAESKSSQNECISKFVHARFEQIASTFVKSLAACNAAAKVPRLKCLLDLMDYVREPAQKTFLRQILPEVILCIREVNHKSREAAFELLNSMLRLWQKLGLLLSQPMAEFDSMKEFIHLVMVGLAGSTNMVSCTCLALASLTSEFRENISGTLIDDLIDTSCLLIRSDNKEIVLASLNLLKILCTIFQQSTLGHYLAKICDAVHSLHEKRTSKDQNNNNNNNNNNNTEANKTHKANNFFNNAAPITKSQRIKALVKLILKKVMKKFSYETVHAKLFEFENESSKSNENTIDMELDYSLKNKTPLTGVIKQGLENLLTNLKKLIEKEKTRKQEDAKKESKSNANKLDLVSIYTTNTHKAANPHLNEVEELLKDSDSEDEIDEVDNRTTRTNKTSKKAERRAQKAGKKQSNDLTWLQENEEEDPLDLLDPMAIKHVLATKPLTKEQIEKKRVQKAKNRGFKQTNDGRLMIDDSDEESDADMKSKKSTKSKKKKKNNNNNDEIGEMMDTLSLSKKSSLHVKKNKRSIEDSDDSDNDDTMDMKSSFKYKAGGSGIHRKLDKNKQSMSDIGSEYKARKAKGDIKLKNKMDPYAYLPFNYSKLNKRKKAKLQGEYKGIVKAVKKGAANAKSSKKH